MCSIYSPASLKAESKELNKPLFQQSESAESAGWGRPAQARVCDILSSRGMLVNTRNILQSRAAWEMLKADRRERPTRGSCQLRL